MANQADAVVDETIDTSTGDEVDAEEALENTDISFEDIQDDEDDTSESEEVEDNTEEESSEAEGDVEQPPEEEESEDSEAEEVESEEEDTTTKDEQPNERSKEQLAQEAFRRREAERKLREERESREKETLDRYLQEAQDDDTELAKRQLEVQQYNLRKEAISLNADKLDVGIQRAAAEIDLLRSDDPVVQTAFKEALDDFEAMFVVKDQHGNPVEVKADVYQYLHKKADSIRQLTGIGARQQVKQKAKEKSATIPRPSKAPKAPKVDEDLLAFDEEASKWQSLRKAKRNGY